MKKKYYEKKIVEQDVLVKTETYCDICGVKIEAKNNYFAVKTHHSNWGNDSIDSFEDFDICSNKCLHKKLDDYYDDKTSKTCSFDIELV